MEVTTTTSSSTTSQRQDGTTPGSKSIQLHLKLNEIKRFMKETRQYSRTQSRRDLPPSLYALNFHCLPPPLSIVSLLLPSSIRFILLLRITLTLRYVLRATNHTARYNTVRQTSYTVDGAARDAGRKKSQPRFVFV